MPREKTGDKGHRLKEVWFKSKIYFTIRRIEHWDRFPREVVEPSPLEIFRSPLNTVLHTLLQLILLKQGGMR